MKSLAKIPIVFGAALFVATVPVEADSFLNPVKGAEVSPTAGVSLATHLQLQGGQIERLSRLHENVAPRRLQGQSKLAQLQNQLRQAQAPTTLDQAKAARLLREQNELQQKMSEEGLATRVKALQILTPIQRAQLESLANDTRFRVRDDQFSQLLLLPVEAMWRPAPNGESQNPASNLYRGPRRDARDSGNGSYGVYGGYGYGGPQVGVYGGYGRGSVGVYGGIGRGGPSIGIGVGRIFGGRY